jgi:hypothetical protein
MGFTMHFHMGGNFDASFDMNVTQGQAKQKASVAKKRKSDAAKKPEHSQPVTPSTDYRGLPQTSGGVTPSSSYFDGSDDRSSSAR